MSQLVKTKRQANFKDFKRFGAFKGLVEQKNVVFNLFVCKLGLFWYSLAFKTLVTNSLNKVLLSVVSSQHLTLQCQPVLKHLLTLFYNNRMFTSSVLFPPVAASKAKNVKQKYLCNFT
jgi:hypothetical protein